MSKEIQTKEFDNGLTLVAYCKGSHKLAIASASLENPNTYQLGLTKRQFDYECGWRPNLNFEVITKVIGKKKALDAILDLARLGKVKKNLLEKDYSYRARVGNQYLQGRGFTSSERDADVFESETEPRQRINQMRKSKRFTPKGKVTIEKFSESQVTGSCELGQSRSIKLRNYPFPYFINQLIENIGEKKFMKIYNKHLQTIKEAEMKVRVAKRRLFKAKRELNEALAFVESEHTRRVQVDPSEEYDIPFPNDAVWVSPSGLFFVRKVNGSYFLYDDPEQEEFASFSTLTAAKSYVKDLERDGYEIELKPWEDPENYM